VPKTCAVADVVMPEPFERLPAAHGGQLLGSRTSV